MKQMISVTLSKGTAVDIELQPDIWPVRADRTQLEQIVLNLVLNARDAMPNGGRISLSSGNTTIDAGAAERYRTVPPGRYVTISIKDTGTGMDKETQSRMFEPFFTTKPKGTGVGLGLATVYSIVKASSGYIRAYSELGIGSSFIVYLPAVEPETGQGEAARAVVDATGSETILLVEDEPAVRELARRFLEQKGYHVLEAAGGPEALRISRSLTTPIHLLVTDVVMPLMSGREVALQLASERPDMKVLYMSGHTEDAIVHHGVLQHGVEFLQKPFKAQDLVGYVRRILDGRT
jgi:CheY-like chemotaxis protein